MCRVDILHESYAKHKLLSLCLKQLAIAREYVDYHTKAFGYSKSNVEYVKGYIEKLGEAGLTDNSFDLIV